MGFLGKWLSEAIVLVGPALIDDEEGEIGAPHSDGPASEVVSDEPDMSTSNATEGEAIVVVGLAVGFCS